MGTSRKSRARRGRPTESLPRTPDRLLMRHRTLYRRFSGSPNEVLRKNPTWVRGSWSKLETMCVCSEEKRLVLSPTTMLVTRPGHESSEGDTSEPPHFLGGHKHMAPPSARGQEINPAGRPSRGATGKALKRPTLGGVPNQDEQALGTIPSVATMFPKGWVLTNYCLSE